MLRIPGWADTARITINGKAFDGPAQPGTYAVLHRTWTAGDVVELDLPLRVRLMVAHPKAKDLRGRVAVMRGPVVYCLESPDLPKGMSVSDVAIPAGIDLTPHFEKDLLGGVTMLKGRAVKEGTGRGDVPAAAREGKRNERLYRELTVRKALAADGETLNLTLIPYFAWANRGVSHMTVWLPLAGRTARGG